MGIIHILMSQYLVKELLKVAGPQFQLCNLIRPCAGQIFNHLFVIVQGYVLVSNLKVVGQR